MRSDVKLERKCVHLKIRRGVHAALRQELLRRDLSLQEVMDAFAEEVVSGRRSTLGVLDRLAAEKLRRKLGPLQPKLPSRMVDVHHPVFEHDEESLYALIQENDSDDLGSDGSIDD